MKPLGGTRAIESASDLPCPFDSSSFASRIIMLSLTRAARRVTIVAPLSTEVGSGELVSSGTQKTPGPSERPEMQLHLLCRGIGLQGVRQLREGLVD